MTLNIEAASKYHRLLIVTIAVHIVVAYLISGTISESYAPFAWIPFLALYSYFAFRLSEAIGEPGAKWAIAALIPILNWFAILVLLNKCNKEFKAAGLKIGFFGGVKGTA
jgi:hypothetical protein